LPECVCACCRWAWLTCGTLYRGAGKSLDRLGRKQARKHVRDARDFNNIETRAGINFFFFFARQGAEGNSRHSDRNISLFPFLVGLKTYQHPCMLRLCCAQRYVIVRIYCNWTLLLRTCYLRRQRPFFEKLVFAQLVKKFGAFCGIRGLIAVFMGPSLIPILSHQSVTASCSESSVRPSTLF